MAPKKTTNTTSMTDAQLKALIAQGVADALAEIEANQSKNGDDSHDSGSGRPVQADRECTYPDFLKCKPLNFKGIEGVIGLTQWFEKMESVFSISNCTVACQVKFETCTLQGNALTWWNSHVKTTTPEAAHAMPWKTLKKMMIDKYCPRGKIKKIESEMWNLKVKGTDVISTFADRQAENKRKLDNNNQAQQKLPKRQNVAQAYVAGTGERKEYAGTLPLCNKCKFHHNGQCTVKGTELGTVHALVGGETNQDPDDMKDDINA
ncbi:reverse transcriptase domain-containing protein [Tanacetum coccineum]|uniref:Reverse transcriptase domain-containing protein n=1 Tax=Tanacetum coccineum TaxID=301880 RepID=A0ABQ5FXV1_9ASTR